MDVSGTSGSSLSWERSSLNLDRRTAREQDEDLLVFGYSCKLFKDDAKANHIERGEHLIPWSGNESGEMSIQIDRYDVRGYLHDMSLYEAKSNLNTKNSDNQLTEHEMDVEERCNIERFSDLKSAENELQDEEMKRLRAALEIEGAYHEIGFKYDPPEIEEAPEPPEIIQEVQETFTPPSGLSIPKNIELPSNEKLHNVIEKTAAFVCKHGPQMEIIIKAKQSKNQNFMFLNFDHILNPYYKHIISCIKSGSYAPKETEHELDSANGSEDGNNSDDDDDYLHPSLMGGSRHSILELPKIPKISSEHDSYSQLVKSLKDKIQVNLEIVTPTLDEEDQSNTIKQLSPTFFTKATLTLQDQNQNVHHSRSSLLPSPPPEVEAIIEKLAQYVSKSGEDFEATVRRRGEERFEFLNPGNVFHAHYIRRKLYYLEEKRKEQALEMKQRASESEPEKQNSKNVVSFCLTFKDKKLSTKSSTDSNRLDSELKHKVLTIDDSKRNELALADKLAIAARERLTREKQIQEERKRKAALFISMLKSKQADVNSSTNTDSKPDGPVTFGPNLPSISIIDPNDPSISSRTPSPLRESSEHNFKATKSNAILPFVCNDKDLKESSERSSHKRHKHNHESRKSRRSRSPSRSPSRSRTSRKLKKRRRSRSRNR